MAQPLKISAVVTIDPSQAKSGGQEAQAAIAGIGGAADQAASKIQQLINRSAGIGGSANQNIREWTGALAMSGQSIDQLRAKYNPLFAVISQYKTNLTEIRTLTAQGVLSTDEMTAAISRQRQAALASIDAIKGRNQAIGFGGDASFRRANLGYQLNDIGQGLAMGAPVSMIAAQQLPQIAQLYAGQGGIKAAIGDIGAIATGVVGAVGALPLALGAAGAAALAYATLSRDSVKSVDDVLSAHRDSIKALAEAYGIAEQGARSYSAADRAVAEAAARNSLIENSARQVESAKELRGQFTSFITPGRSAGGFYNPLPDFKPFQEAFQQLDAGIRSGSVNAEEFVQKVKSISDANPGTQKFADEILRAADGLLKLNTEATKTQDIFTRIASAGPVLDPLGAFDPDKAQSDRANRARSLYQQDQMKYAADVAQASARTVAEKIAAARAAADAQYNPNESDADRQKRIDRAGELVRISAEKDAAEAQRSRLRSLDQTLAAQRLEFGLIGQSTAAMEAQRMEARLLAEAKEAARKNGGVVSPDEVTRIKEAAQEYGRLAEAIKAANVLREQRQTIDMLQTEISLVGESEQYRRRALALAEAEQLIASQGIASNSARAAEIRSNAIEIAKERSELSRLEDAWGRVQSAGESAIDGVVDSLRKGDIGGALDSIATDFEKTMLDLAVKNPLKNALLGTNYGTIGDAGGILSRLMGGNAAGTSLGSSVASMAVNASTVIVNGGISAAPGLGATALAANQNLPGDLGSYASAIKQIESGGDYSRLGPRLANGDQALGAYQVMRSNLPSWTKSALGRSLSQDEFLRSQAAQDAVFNQQFGASLARYGNANDAASVWFTGRPLSQGAGATDVLGTSGSQYVANFNKALAQVTTTTGAANQNLGTFSNGLGGLGSSLQSAANGASAGGSGGIFGFLGKLFGGGGVSPLSADWSANTTFGSFLGYDRGGYTGPGGKYEPAGVVHRGEVVWSQDDVARAGGPHVVDAMRLGKRGYASGGVAMGASGGGRQSGPIAVVHNYSSAQVDVSEQQDDSGGRQAVFTISDTVGDAMARKGGGASKTLAAQYGVNRTGRRR